MDLSKLTPAPWLIHEDLESGGVYIPRKLGGCPLLHPELDDDPVDLAALEFAALARNAFDVMMRQNWVPVRVYGQWHDHGRKSPPFNRVMGYRWTVREIEWGFGNDVYFTDPFTALVEADKWYRENVESKAKT